MGERLLAARRACTSRRSSVCPGVTGRFGAVPCGWALQTSRHHSMASGIHVCCITLWVTATGSQIVHPENPEDERSCRNAGSLCINQALGATLQSGPGDAMPSPGRTFRMKRSTSWTGSPNPKSTLAPAVPPPASGATTKPGPDRPEPGSKSATLIGWVGVQ